MRANDLKNRWELYVTEPPLVTGVVLVYNEHYENSSYYIISGNVHRRAWQ